MDNMPTEVKEAMKKIKRSYFNQWLKQYRDKYKVLGFVGGVSICDLCIVIDYVDSMVKKVIDTQEQAIREALIALGWMPPETKHSIELQMEQWCVRIGDGRYMTDFEAATNACYKDMKTIMGKIKL